MHDVKVDKINNRLYISLKGFIEDSEVKEASDKVIAAMSELKQGFVIINDISDFKPASKEGGIYIKKAQEEVIKKGASKVIRVVDSVIGKLQFKRLSQEIGASYEVIEVQSLEDAEKYLAK